MSYYPTKSRIPRGPPKSTKNKNINNPQFNPSTYSYEYTNPKHKTQAITLTGSLSQHYKSKPSHEVQQFQNISKYNLPDSKRTLIPQFQPITEKEKTLHKASSFYSRKLQGNSTGPDFISYGEIPKPIQRKNAAKIMQESTQPKNVKQLKSNNLFQKYVQFSQINNIPGPEIAKRLDDNEIKEINIDNINNNKVGTLSVISRVSKNTEIESFQRKVYRDYNSNIACLPGSTINNKEKNKTLVATNSRKNESQIIFGDNNLNSININYNKPKRRVIDEENIFNTRKKRYLDNREEKEEKGKYPRPMSFSGKKILKNRNLDNFNMGLVSDENTNKNFANRNINNGKVNYYNFAPINDKQKYYLMKNKSQITFG